MQHLSISLLLTAAAALAGAAPQAASTQAGNASDYVEFEAAYPPDSTFEFLQQQQHILERCDPVSCNSLAPPSLQRSRFRRLTDVSTRTLRSPS